MNAACFGSLLGALVHTQLLSIIRKGSTFIAFTMMMLISSVAIIKNHMLVFLILDHYNNLHISYYYTFFMAEAIILIFYLQH